MKIAQLRQFVTVVAEHLDFPRAADALGIPLASLYSSIDKLEVEVGHPLIAGDRDKRTLTPPAGVLLLDEARRQIAAAPTPTPPSRRCPQAAKPKRRRARAAHPSSRGSRSRTRSARGADSDVEAELHHVAVLHDVVLALDAGLARRAASATEPVSTRSSNETISALMKPRSKSVWMTPAACGAVSSPCGSSRRGSPWARRSGRSAGRGCGSRRGRAGPVPTRPGRSLASISAASSASSSTSSDSIFASRKTASAGATSAASSACLRGVASAPPRRR